MKPATKNATGSTPTQNGKKGIKDPQRNLWTRTSRGGGVKLRGRIKTGPTRTGDGKPGPWGEKHGEQKRATAQKKGGDLTDNSLFPGGEKTKGRKQENSLMKIKTLISCLTKGRSKTPTPVRVGLE